MRLFVAVDPSQAVADGLARLIEQGRKLAPDAKWVRPENTHLTLAFLGNVEGELAPAIAGALRTVAPAHRPIELRARGVGSFGGQRRPRVLWVGLEGESEALASLQRDVEAALVPLGHRPEERAFHPHLTLARSREGRGDPALGACLEGLKEADLGAFTVGELVLYQSHLSPHGATYTALARLPLGT
ncbi:RNA 2',3'-cyclic phosphodiesterase [Vulgatibacter sp.]|uniref:RNA 2',3'-cyclic phosphodiesterase n=1 Tax=Vulgatibacter sp. TaxID=1971226 RepID=UPI0035645E23